RSLHGPSVAYHPKERGRLEFKAFDMPVHRSDFHAFFLLWLWLVCDDGIREEADDQDRVYDLAAVGRFGWQAAGVVARGEEGLDGATAHVTALDFDPAPLDLLRQRLTKRWLPALPLIAQMEARASIPELLRFVDQAAAAELVPI